MANECLVKTVKGNANIEHPQYLGELRFALADMSEVQSIQLISHEAGAEFKVIGGHFENNQGENIGDKITTSTAYPDGGYGGFYKIMKDSPGAMLIYPKYKTKVLRTSDTVFTNKAVNLNDTVESSINGLYGYTNNPIGDLEHLPNGLKYLSIKDSQYVTGKLSDLLKYTELIEIIVSAQYINVDIPLKGLYPLSELTKIDCYAYGVIEDFVALQIAKKNRTSCESLNIVWPSHNLTFDGADASSGQANNILAWTEGSTSGQYNLTYNGGTPITIAVNSDGTWSKVS